MTLDTQLFYLFNNLAGQSPFFDEVVVFFASWFPYILVAMFLVLVWFSVYAKKEKLEILAVTFISALIARVGVTELIRYFFPRERPFMALDISPLFTDTAWSFPSGHVTFFFAMATVIYLYNKRWGMWFFIATIFITISRVIAGVHYPSDIVGGAIIAVFVGYFTYFFARRWAKNQRIRPIDK